MRLGPRLTWDDIDMRMECVGSRATCDHTIDMASNDVTRQAPKARNKSVNTLVCDQRPVISDSATLALLPLAVAKPFWEPTPYKTIRCS